jgi:hypothetical protein
MRYFDLVAMRQELRSYWSHMEPLETVLARVRKKLDARERQTDA